ncbi:MAG: response regulator transcription factor [Gemmatimonadetes bacterium]|nr:response regulator transcription factor [Gemmatimonadota bacterium]
MAPARESPARVLVVEDEPDIAALVAYQLAREAMRVETVTDGRAALAAADRESPDLIVLDLMLPGLSGYDVLAELRRRPETRGIPVIVLTAKREEEDRVRGLELGADDYVTKPFSPRELLLRVRAVLRRVRQPAVEAGARILRAGSLIVDVDAHAVTANGESVDLTPTEYRLLVMLLERRGRAQSRKQLLAGAWDMDSEVADRLKTRTVDMHVRRLRAKLGPEGDAIETVRGFGYRFRAPEAQE